MYVGMWEELSRSDQIQQGQCSIVDLCRFLIPIGMGHLDCMQCSANNVCTKFTGTHTTQPPPPPLFFLRTTTYPSR